jgi:60 kDa SS-A/Ro ribonucleoprotein
MANYNALYRWVTCRHLDDSIAYGLRTVDRKGVVSTYKEVWGSEWPEVIIAFEALQQVKGEAATKMLINAHSKVVTWEMIPTEELKHPAVWSALLPNLPMTATLRNLGRMTANGCLKPMSEDAKIVVDRLTNQEAIKAARIHPVAVLAALGTYSQGHGERGKLEWKPIPQIVDALDHAFYLAFGNVEPTGKRTLLALDVSGSMAWGEIAGIPSLTPARGATAMALVTARTEPNYYTMGFSTTFKNLGITAKDTLVSAMKKTSDQNFGGTDCALPMVWAAKEGIEVDTFVIYTDDETWAGDLHPFQALQLYRKKTGIPAKLVVVAMTSNGFTLADPNDAGMLDVVGFDTATPQLISDFSKE